MARKPKASTFDAAGWTFWIITFLVALAPCIYLGFQITYEGASRVVPVIVGVVGASLAAGCVTWAVNAVIQYRAKKLRNAKRKEARKKK